MFNEEIERWERKMAMFFDLAERAEANGDDTREVLHRERAMLIGDFIKALEHLKWEHT